MSAEDPKSKLLEAAGPVFAEKGYDGATVRDICERAGLNVASVNYYFGDKERLYIETVKQAAHRREQSAPFPSWPVDVDPASKLRGFVATMLTRMLKVDTAGWQRELMMREMLRPTKACEELVRDYIRPDFQVVKSIIGELVDTKTPEHIVEKLAFSIVGQCLNYRVAGDIVEMLVGKEGLEQHYSIESLAEHISRVTLAAVGAAPAYPSRRPAANTSAPLQQP